MTTKTRNISLFDFQGRPPIYKALPISLQHVLAMIAGVITPPIIIAGVVGSTPQEKLLLIQVAVLASGICTLFHLYGVWKFGARLPAIFGVGFAYVPTSTFSQNVGIVAMTKVISRSVLAIAGLFMVLAGLSPKFSAIMTTIPYPVLGGATVTVFGMITMTGIQLLIKDELSARNVTIVGLSLALALGISQVPAAIEQFPQMVQSVIGGAPIVVAAITSFVLNIVLPSRSLADERREREEIARADAAAAGQGSDA
ncbi:solute carrier family 23 protein [Halomonas marinisediminis]|uniref:Uracil permease n=1 Tax=Halomonas marinisediminis TaxID=2546095 RepID=A0ABY2D4L5_9GAMM|nr:solute carrier family 23 protein [Halomonas marinisediminis]TDB01410.1 hypothetical protein E0702_12710 [Halomonas marinisediminis]